MNKNLQMVRCIEALLVLLLSLTSVVSLAVDDIFDLGEESFQPIDFKGQLQSVYIRDVTQDKAGFMWIGTENGLYRFDGYEFRHFKYDENDPTSVGGDLVYGLYAAADGRLWVSTTSVLSVYDPNTEQFKSYQHDEHDPKSLINNEINSMLGSGNGGLWIATYNGLDYLGPNADEFKHFLYEQDHTKAVLDEGIHSLLLSHNMDLYVGTSNGLSRVKAGGSYKERLVFKDSPEFELNSNGIRSLAQDASGRIWIGTTTGGLYWMDEDEVLHNNHPSWDRFEQLKSGTIRRILEPIIGEIWVTTFSHGAAILDAKSGALLRTLEPVQGVEHSLQSAYAQTLSKDKSGLLWLGHRQGNGGLDVFNTNNKTSRMIYFESGNPARVNVKKINKILQLKNGQFWFGGEGLGMLDLDTGTQPLTTKSLKILDKRSRFGSEIGGIAEDEAGLVWLMFLKNGVAEYDVSSNASQYYTQSELGCIELEVMTYEPPSSLWLACNDNPALLHFDTRSKKSTRYELTKDQLVKFSKNYALVVDQQSTVWLGTEHGLFYLTKDQRNKISVMNKTSLYGRHISNLLVSEKGRLWIDSQSGLYVRDKMVMPPTFVSMSERHNLPKKSMFGGNMIEANTGEIWGDHGVFRTTEGSFVPVGKADGIPLAQNWPRSVAKTKQGTLLVGSRSGLLMLKPARYTPWVYEPKVVISNLLIDDQPVPSSNRGNITIGPNVSNWSAEVAALDFSSPSSNRYQYRLLGFDDRWVETSADYRQIVYRKLPPGEYELQVKGSNRLGKFSSDMVRLPVTVLPKWYQTLWFKMLMVALVLMLIYGAYALRVRQINANRLALKRLVQVRTQELDERNSELSDAMEELILTQEQLVANEKMASLGLLVAGVAHEVNTPLGISVTAASHLVNLAAESEASFNDGSLTEATLRTLFEKLKSSGDILLSNLQRAAQLIQSFKGVAVDQNTDDASTFVLKAYLEKILVSLSPLLDQHSIKIVLECDPDWQFTGSKGAFSQILTNLIENSIKHGFAGEGPGDVKIEVNIASKYYLLKYSDNGAGVPQSALKKIFDPFFSTSAQNDGTGLGLSIVYNLVTQTLKGRISCESVVSEGVTFTIAFPVGDQ